MITPLSDLDIAVRLGMAGLTGLAVGIEREWSGHASGPRARFAGVRTFLLLGLVGGVSGAVRALPGARRPPGERTGRLDPGQAGGMRTMTMRHRGR